MSDTNVVTLIEKLREVQALPARSLRANARIINEWAGEAADFLSDNAPALSTPTTPDEGDEARARKVLALREALAPFAAPGSSDQYIASDAPDDGWCAARSFTAGDYRRARTAIKGER